MITFIQWFIILMVEFAILFTYQASLEKLKFIGKALVVIFVIQDWLMNWVLSIPMLDAPKTVDELVTGRINRYGKKYKSKINDKKLNGLERWRLVFADWLGAYLNKYDPGHYKWSD